MALMLKGCVFLTATGFAELKRAEELKWSGGFIMASTVVSLLT